MTDGTLKDEIAAEMREALRSGDKVRLGALRMLMASIKNREVELLHELSDDEVREVAGREVKKRGESIEAFDAAGRTELADRERAERDVVSVYAPEQLSDAELEALIGEAVAATGATSIGEIGKVMGFVMGKARGRVDGRAVQERVRAQLEGNQSPGR